MFGKLLGASALLMLAACGGAEPAPQTPARAPEPVAPKADPAAACSELALGMSQLGTMVRTSDVTTSSAGILRSSKRAADSFGALRVQIKKAADLDPSLSTEANPLDATLAIELSTFDAVAKSLESEAKSMRDIVSDTEKLRLAFASAGPCAKKDVDCASKQRVDEIASRILWAPLLLGKARSDIERVAFKAPDLEAKKNELVTKLAEGDRVLSEHVIERTKLQKVAEDKRDDLKSQTEALFKRCGMETVEKADDATKRPQWISSKEPDLRKMVMVVRVVPEGRIRARLDEWAAVTVSPLRREIFAGATQGGFGSGFYVMPKEGEIYVVTNRHVVDFGDRATLQLADGSNVGADILYTDPHADLAVLRPDPKADLKVTYGLGLEPEPAKDRQVVIATGYPGLGAKPSYQTTKGYVSNQRFADSYDGSVYIQHTAPVDRGGSGGPLTSERNLVLGVNTLKIRERENVAMSVPALAVAEAVAHAREKKDAEVLRREAREACMDVIAELGNLAPKGSTLYQRISLSMVAESGSASFNAIADRELSEMLLDEPIDALRVAIVERLLRDARLGHLNPYETCASPEPVDFEHILTMDRVRFKVRVGAETKDLVLKREFGRFQLLRFEIVPPAKPGEKEKDKPATPKKKGQAAKK